MLFARINSKLLMKSNFIAAVAVLGLFVGVFVFTTNTVFAAAWWSYYTNYEQGWPAPHNAPVGSIGSNCTGPPQFPNNHCELPSYASVSVASNPAQKIVARVELTGHTSATSYNYNPVTYSGSMSSISPGTAVVIEWACQDWQSFTWSASSNTCSSYDAFGNCSSYTNNGGTGQSTYYQYSGAVGTGFVAGPNVGGRTVYPQQTTTYSVYCAASGNPNTSFGYGASNGPIPSTPQMTFVVNVTAAPSCPYASAEQPFAAGYSVLYPSASRKVSGAGINACLTNNTASYFYVPTGTSAEFQAFLNSAASLGVLGGAY